MGREEVERLMTRFIGADKAAEVMDTLPQSAEGRQMVDTAVDAFGRLDVLVNNAGTTSFIPHDQLEKVTEEDWSSIMGVNLRGPLFLVLHIRLFQTALEDGDLHIGAQHATLHINMIRHIGADLKRIQHHLDRLTLHGKPQTIPEKSMFGFVLGTRSNQEALVGR